ncbi:2171_t:CDS:2, partial [Gigaspora rosea]
KYRRLLFASPTISLVSTSLSTGYKKVDTDQANEIEVDTDQTNEIKVDTDNSETNEIEVDTSATIKDVQVDTNNPEDIIQQRIL